MRIHNFRLFLFFLIGMSLNAQQKDTLFTLNGNPVFIDEFEQLFLNNSAENAPYAAQEYLDMLINYKLKIAEALDQGLDTLTAFRNEFEGYRKQLISSFSKSPDITEKLVREAYERSLNEIKAKNILISLPKNATPIDTLKAYNRLVEARNLILNGADFDRIALKYSLPEVSEDQIDLGFFTVFQMTYPFESIAYQTKVGEVSKPFRSEFGYHLLKVVDKRPANRKVTVKHLQLMPAENDTVYAIKSKLIQKIYDELQAGMPFDSLIKNYSEDKLTAQRGGLMKPFGVGTLLSRKFEEEVFKLKVGAYSKPFETEFGWHIVQLIKRENQLPFEDQKTLLEMSIKRNDRFKLIENGRVTYLKSIYKTVISENNELMLQELIAQMLKNNFKPDSGSQAKIIFQIEGKSYRVAEFLNWFSQKMRNHRISDKMQNQSFDQLFNEYLGVQLIQFSEDHLEQFNPEFNSIVQKYHDGLLVYNIMEDRVWEKAKTDTLGLKQFFEENRRQYTSQSVEGFLIAASMRANILNKVLKYYQNSDSSGLKDVEVLRKLFKKVNFAEISEDELARRFTASGNPSSTMKEGQIVSVGNTKYAFLKGIDIATKKLNYEESNPKLFNDYQDFLEQKWLQSLRVKYQVKVHPEAIRQIEELIK